MHLRLPNKLGQAGDTIVEVMVVLAVLGLALGIAFATANRSLQNTRQAEETSQATRYVQSMVEAIRSMGPAGNKTDPACDASTNTTNIYCQDKPFCTLTGNSAEPNITTFPYSITSPSCSFGSPTVIVLIYNCDVTSADPGWAPVCQGIPGITSTSDTFVVQASWPDVNGTDTDHVTQAYRMHPL